MTLRVVAAAQPAVALNVVKARLGVLHSDDDATLTALIATATALVEAATQRRFKTQTLDWVLPCWRSEIRFPVAPVSADDLEVTYRDAQGVEQEFPRGSYCARPSGQTMALRPVTGACFPMVDHDADEPIVITFRAGADVVPDEAISAIVLQTQYLYERDPNWKMAPSGLPDVVEMTLAPLRWD